MFSKLRRCIGGEGGAGSRSEERKAHELGVQRARAVLAAHLSQLEKEVVLAYTIHTNEREPLHY